MSNHIKITWKNGECYEASITGRDISYTENALEDMVENFAKLICSPVANTEKRNGRIK